MEERFNTTKKRVTSSRRESASPPPPKRSKSVRGGVPYESSGLGLPYAPQHFPQHGDLWRWKATGFSKTAKGFWNNRNLYPPKSLLQLEGCPKVFRLKSALKKFLRDHFPELDLEKFMASFEWKIPAATSEIDIAKTERGFVEETAGEVPVSSKKSPCKLGNGKCGYLINKPAKTKQCGICCVEIGFCGGCSCILCAKTIDQSLENLRALQCEGKLDNGQFCGHNAHLDCALLCHTAGVERENGLDIEYYCRRCDTKTDLVQHMIGWICQCRCLKESKETDKNIRLMLRLIQGTQRTGGKQVQNYLESALVKFHSGLNFEYIQELQKAEGKLKEIGGKHCIDQPDPPICSAVCFNNGENPEGKPQPQPEPSTHVSCEIEGDLEDSDTIPSFNPFSCENNGSDTISFKEVSTLQQDWKSCSEKPKETSFPINTEIHPNASTLEVKIQQVLTSLKKSQEIEYEMVKGKLCAQKDLILSLGKQITAGNYKKALCDTVPEISRGSQKLQDLHNEVENFEQMSALAMLRRMS